MLTSLAQLGSVPADVAAWMAAAAASAFGVNQILAFLDRQKEQPPPAQTYATREAFATLDARVGRIEESVEKLSIADQDRARRIHERIDVMSDTVLRAIGTLEGRLAAHRPDDSPRP